MEKKNNILVVGDSGIGNAIIKSLTDSDFLVLDTKKEIDKNPFDNNVWTISALPRLPDEPIITEKVGDRKKRTQSQIKANKHKRKASKLARKNNR